MNLLDQGAIDATAISIASKTTYSAGAASVLGWLVSINWLTVIGAAVAVIGLVGNLYFQLRRDRRETRESRARIEALKRGQK